MYKKSKKTICIGILSFLVLVVLDQITKYLAVVFLKGKNAFELIPGIFELRYLENPSAAFGVDPISILQKIFHFQYFIDNPSAFLKWKMGFFIIFTLIVVCIMFLVYLKIPQVAKLKYFDCILIMFMSGAIGNFIDRLMNNYVIDFFYFKLINFPIFNVADIYVTVGAFLLIVLGLFYYKEEDYELIFPNKKNS